MSLLVSAPGKIILMGEHAAVYGKPALVAAVDRRLWAKFDVDPGTAHRTVRLDLPAVGVEETVSWDAVSAYAAARRVAWDRYAKKPSPARFDEVRGDDPAHLVKVALGAVREAIGASWQPPAIRLQVRSDLPLGGGFGSSAAVAVSLVFGTLCLAGMNPDDDLVAQLALDAERRQHGQPSGVDSATVQQGGLLWADRDDTGDLRTSPVQPTNQLLGRFEVFDTGTPSETTGEVVSAVRDRIASEPEQYQAVLDGLERATRSLKAVLESPDSTPQSVATAIGKAHLGLDRLGIVPPTIGRVIEALEVHGVAAKLSGAGALTGTSAGSLLVYDRAAKAQLGGPMPALSFRQLDLQLGAPGVRRDPG